MSRIIIKPNISKAIKYYSPLLIIMLTAIFLLMYLMSIQDINCGLIFHENAAYVLLLFTTYLLPIIFLFFSVYLFIFGYKVLRYKYCPPIDIPVFKEKESDENKICYLKSIFFVLTPIIAMWFIVVGDEAYVEILNEKTKSELINGIEKGCIKKSMGQRN